jgi:nitroreductase
MDARAYGLHACPQEAWTHWHRTVPPFLGLPADHILFCGIALGFADEGAAINRWRAPREGVDGFATFRGFAESDMPQS